VQFLRDGGNRQFPLAVQGLGALPDQLIASAANEAYKHLCGKTLCEGTMNPVRWNIAVSSDTDQSVRMFLVSQGGGRKGDLSRFIEEAVRTYIFERAVEQAKAANANVSETDLTAIITEAVQWAREH
jgi:hypothetical protein